MTHVLLACLILGSLAFLYSLQGSRISPYQADNLWSPYCTSSSPLLELLSMMYDWIILGYKMRQRRPSCFQGLFFLFLFSTSALYFLFRGRFVRVQR
jgi:hypothetical protein